MASDFHMGIRWCDQDLHLDLKGEFDGSAARQLLYFMRQYCMEADTVYIHTEALTSIKPLGLHLFCYCMGELGKQSERFVITGEKAGRLLCALPAGIPAYGETGVASYTTHQEP